MRLLGNERTSYSQNFPSSLLAQPNLENEIPFKGGTFCNTLIFNLENLNKFCCSCDLTVVELVALKLHVVVRILTGLSFPLFSAFLCLRDLTVVPEPPLTAVPANSATPKAPRWVTRGARNFPVQSPLKTETGSAFTRFPRRAAAVCRRSTSPSAPRAAAPHP
jgi:hypothetical protein